MDNIDMIHSIIEEIEKKNLDLERYLENLHLSSRNDLLKDIIRDIVLKNQFLKDLEIPVEKIYKTEKKKEKQIKIIIEDIISKIINNPSKKVIYLREFLQYFNDITDSDKDVILQSLKDEETDKIKENMLSLIEMFNLKL